MDGLDKGGNEGSRVFGLFVWGGRALSQGEWRDWGRGERTVAGRRAGQGGWSPTEGQCGRTGRRSSQECS